MGVYRSCTEASSGSGMAPLTRRMYTSGRMCCSVCSISAGPERGPSSSCNEYPCGGAESFLRIRPPFLGALIPFGIPDLCDWPEWWRKTEEAQSSERLWGPACTSVCERRPWFPRLSYCPFIDLYILSTPAHRSSTYTRRSSGCL
jgi:hypothetical protein